MAAITKWLKPDIAVFTRMGTVPVHVEYFKDRAAVVAEKSALIAAIKQGGAAVLNADDADVLASRSKKKEAIITFGYAENADFKISNAEIRYDAGGMPSGIAFKIEHGGAIVPFSMPGT